MREAERTTREQIEDRLRLGSATPSALADEFEVGRDTAIDHVQHVARSLEGSGEQVVVAPPRCRDCDFDGFDDRANVPSRCPECKSESVTEPVFAIQ